MKTLSIFLALSLLLSGCGNGRFTAAGGQDVETLLLVRTVGVDMEGDGIVLTVCSGVGLDGSAPIVLREEGESISHVLSSLRYNAAGREPFFTHTQHVILGEETAKEALPVSMDWILRSMEIRLDADLYVLRDGKAGELISDAMGESTAVSDELTLMKNNPAAAEIGMICSCGETAARLSEGGSALVCALSVENTDDSADGAGEKMPVPEGYAILSREGLLGYTERDCGLAVGLLENRVEDSVLSAGDASLTVLDGGSRYIPAFDGNGALSSLTVSLHIRCSLMETTEPDSVSDPAYRRKLEESAEKTLREETEQLLRQSQEMETDFLDLRGKCSRAAPRAFRKMPVSWEEAFPTLPIQTEVRVELVRTYNLERRPEY